MVRRVKEVREAALAHSSMSNPKAEEGLQRVAEALLHRAVSEAPTRLRCCPRPVAGQGWSFVTGKIVGPAGNSTFGADHYPVKLHISRKLRDALRAEAIRAGQRRSGVPCHRVLSGGQRPGVVQTTKSTTPR